MLQCTPPNCAALPDKVQSDIFQTFNRSSQPALIATHGLRSHSRGISAQAHPSRRCWARSLCWRSALAWLGDVVRAVNWTSGGCNGGNSQSTRANGCCWLGTVFHPRRLNWPHVSKPENDRNPIILMLYGLETVPFFFSFWTRHTPAPASSTGCQDSRSLKTGSVAFGECWRRSTGANGGGVWARALQDKKIAVDKAKAMLLEP